MPRCDYFSAREGVAEVLPLGLQLSDIGSQRALARRRRPGNIVLNQRDPLTSLQGIGEGSGAATAAAGPPVYIETLRGPTSSARGRDGDVASGRSLHAATTIARTGHAPHRQAILETH